MSFKDFVKKQREREAILASRQAAPEDADSNALKPEPARDASKPEAGASYSESQKAVWPDGDARLRERGDGRCRSLEKDLNESMGTLLSGCALDAARGILASLRFPPVCHAVASDRPAADALAEVL